jgi:alkylresorcinol/alkylpyrone synthase
MLRNVLSPQVPLVAAQSVKEVLQSLLASAKVDCSQIAAWILHPGGREVLLAMRKEIGLNGQDLRWSEAVLAQYGNLSSPSVFFVLHAALRDSAPGGFWWMASFGAGFSSHGALLEVD